MTPTITATMLITVLVTPSPTSTVMPTALPTLIVAFTEHYTAGQLIVSGTVAQMAYDHAAIWLPLLVMVMLSAFIFGGFALWGRGDKSQED